MDAYRGMWHGVLALIVVAALGLWWLSASQSASLDIGEPLSVGAPALKDPAPGTISVAPRARSDVVAIVKSLAGATQFASIFSTTGVAAELTGKGPYTVFVPTNDAFAAAVPGTVANLSAAEKKRLVRYHVVGGRAIDPEAVQSGSIQSLSKDALNFEVADQAARVNNAYIIKAYPAWNGVVYLISAILVPPRPTTMVK